MFIRLHKKGQSTLEYGIIIAVVVAALVAMQAYVKRGMQGRLRQASDDIGEQFSPGYTTGTVTTDSYVASTETLTGGSRPITSTVATQTQDRQSCEQVEKLRNEWWPGDPLE